MSNQATIKMIMAYLMESPITSYFASMFRAPAENFYNGEFVEFDIERDDEDIAIVITDLSTGHRMSSADIYTNKKFKAPILKEAITLNSHDLVTREFGQNPFQNPNYRANIMARMAKGMRKAANKIMRTIELQAAQVLQTGTITLKDENGEDRYVIDFKPKATHFPTVTASWGSGSEDKYAEVESLLEVVRNDGKTNADELIFGDDAWKKWQNDSDLQAILNNRRIDIGSIGRQEFRNKGESYKGSFDIGNYAVNMFTYTGRYKDPQTGNMTKYMDPDKVVARDSEARMDATFGGIPNIGKELGIMPQLLPEMPSRLSMGEQVLDLNPLVWTSVDGCNLYAGVASRPLMIPTAIDSFGCLDTIAP